MAPVLKSDRPIADCSPATVLYIDDEPMLLEVAKAFLELEKDVIVDVATSATEGLRKLGEEDYEVVVSDFQMPEMDGLAFLRTIRARSNNVPFILFTGKGREEVAMEALNSGANFYLQKGGEPVAQFGELRHVILQLAQRQRAEQMFYEREARLNAMYQSAAIGIVVAGEDHMIKEANQAFLDMLGYSLEEIKVKHIEEITYNDDRESDREPLQSMVRGEMRSYQVEKRYIRRDGSLVWGRTTVAPLKQAQVERRHLIATVENIDERKKVEARLSRTEGIFDTLAKHYPDGMLLVYDQDLRYIRVGGQGLEVSGLNRESLEGRTVGEVFTEEMAADVASHYKKALAGVPSVGEIVFNGRTYLAFNLPVMDDMGHTFAGLTFTQDINERKVNEAGLARADRSLRMLTECNQALVRVKNEKELLNDICHIITTFGNYKLAWVGLAGQGRSRTVHPVAKAGEAKGFMSQLEVSYGEDELGQGPAGKATRTGQVSIMSDLWVDKEFEAWRDRAIRFNLRSGIGLPLSHRGKPIGVLAIYSDVPGAFAEEDEIALLTELAMDLSYGLSNIRQQARRTRSEQTSARRGKQLEQLALAAQKLNTVLELDTIMDRLITSAMDVVGATSGMAGKMVDDRMVYAKINRRGGIEPMDVVFRSGEDVTGHVMVTHRPYFTNHPETDPHVIPRLREMIGYYNLAVVPVLDRNGRLMGCFWMQDKPGDGFDEGDLEALTSLAAGASIAMENARMVDELRNREVDLEQANRKLGLINRMTRHDLLNQLTSLTGYLEMARMKAADGKVQEYLEKALRSSGNIAKHLSFARDYQEMGTTRPSWISVKGAVCKGASTLSLGKVTLTTSVNGLEVLADRMFEKVFHNLVDDSVRHGGTIRNISISCVERDDGLVILYEDDGVGIPPEKKASIFEMTSGQHGLYMAREILGITGMSIREIGKQGEGTCFEIVVPHGNYRIPIGVA